MNISGEEMLAILSHYVGEAEGRVCENVCCGIAMVAAL